jgi:glycosyltransferase involved in cell wall biosynthesis
MRIVIGIPSLNESDSIANVTHQADIGASRVAEKFHLEQSLIINADSNSIDNTSDVFLKTETRAKKISLQPEGAPGKGANILALISAAISHKAYALILLDADVVSVTPEWIESFLEPIFSKHADFVAPIYARNRFEGSTTNHFAFPLMWGYFGVPVRQPIAGDFALGQSFLNHLAAQRRTEKIRGYGIDIFLTIHAAAGNFNIHQIELGLKKHKPSFSKLTHMFPEVAASAFDLIRSQAPRPPHDRLPSLPCSIDDTQPFTHYEEAQELFREMRGHAIELLPEYVSYVYEKQARKLSEEIHSESPALTGKIWSELLAGWLLSPHGAEHLLPAFACRTVTFWNACKNLHSAAVEREVIYQAELVQAAIRRRVVDECV